MGSGTYVSESVWRVRIADSSPAVELEFKGESGAFLYISAQKQVESGTIRALIDVDGEVIQQAESNSKYGIATVSGKVP